MINARTVFVALSGGVDSSVAALLLRDAGYRVVGVYMKNWSEATHGQLATDQCSWEEEYEIVQQVCEHLNIPCRSVNFEREYREQVIEPFYREYRDGRTPNPDTECNRKIKFDAFLRYALASGADLIATGHHVRRRIHRRRAALFHGADHGKDQSYFLYGISQQALDMSLFPVGEYTKTQVREFAQAAGLPNADRPDSQGLCFVGKIELGTFLGQRYDNQPGPVHDTAGKQIGTHPGYWRYTVGQRHGMGIQDGNGPYFVRSIEPQTNTVTVTANEQDLLSSTVVLEREHWINGTPPLLPLHCTAKPRYRSPDAPVVATRTASGLLHARFVKPQRALSPGQAVVFYNGDRLLGGATITRAL